MIEVRQQAFDPYAELYRYEHEILQSAGKYGALVSFVGTMRDFNEAQQVTALTLEHYPGMTEKQLAALQAEAMRRWPILDVLLLHRVGELLPGDPIVVVGVWAVHRAAAFDACRYLIEALKSQAPFWKKEATSTGVRWVEHNTPGK